MYDLTLERQWEHQAEQLATSDSSWLLSIASAGRVNVSCEGFPSRTELVNEDRTGMQRVSQYPDPELWLGVIMVSCRCLSMILAGHSKGESCYCEERKQTIREAASFSPWV